jgi:hypothetical protein
VIPATFMNTPWVDAAAPELAAAEPYRALHPAFGTVIATAADLAELIFALQATAVASAHFMASIDGKTVNNVMFAADEIEMQMPNADQEISVCSLLMRTHYKGELSRTERIALIPFVPFEQFDFNLSAANTRRALRNSIDAARRIQL